MPAKSKKAAAPQVAASPLQKKLLAAKPIEEDEDDGDFEPSTVEQDDDEQDYEIDEDVAEDGEDDGEDEPQVSDEEEEVAAPPAKMQKQQQQQQQKQQKEQKPKQQQKAKQQQQKESTQQQQQKKTAEALGPVKAEDLVNKKKKFKNKQRTLILSSRGVSSVQRYLMKDFLSLMPHAKKDSKFDGEKHEYAHINELCSAKKCQNSIFFEGNIRTKELYMYVLKSPIGPTLKFRVSNGMYAKKEARQNIMLFLLTLFFFCV